MQTTLEVAPRRELTERRREAQRVEPSRLLELRPAIDVLESGDAFRVIADVPGVDASGCDVRIEARRLSIQASRPTHRGTTVRYAAEIVLPDTVDPATLSAELRNGVLEIAMAKSASARARRIEVRSS